MSYQHCWVAIITLLLATEAGLVGQKDSQREPSIQRSTYASADGAFRFSYPANPQVFRAGYIKPPTDCDLDAIVCVVYPNQTTTGSSTFEVRVIQAEAGTGSMTRHRCIDPDSVESNPEFTIDAKEPTKTIGGILFVHGFQEVVAGPQSSFVDRYRTFHNRTCFELNIGDFGTDMYLDDDSGNHEPAPTAAQNEELNPFPKILRSFKFLK